MRCREIGLCATGGNLKSKEWLDRGDNAQDAFGAFDDYWKGFNNCYAGKGPERQLIKNFLEHRIKEEDAKDLISQNSTGINYLLSEPAIDMRGNGNDTSQYMDEYNNSESNSGKLVAIFMIIYQIRCNLVHGQKSPSRDRDLHLCESSCGLIRGVIELAK